MQKTYYIKVNGMYGFYYSRSTDEQRSKINNWSQDVYYIDTYSSKQDAKEMAKIFHKDEGYTISDKFEPEYWTIYESNLLAENQLINPTLLHK